MTQERITSEQARKRANRVRRGEKLQPMLVALWLERFADQLDADAERLKALEAERDLAQGALKVIYATVRGDEKSECWTIRKWLDKRGLFNDDIQASERLIAMVCKAALAASREGKA